jgi:phage terminase small subunit
MQTTEERFVAEYIKNGNNGTKAYLAIKPTVSPNSAAVSAHRLLQKTSVMNALEDITDKSKEEAIASKQYLINEAHEIGKEARSKGVYGSALKAVEVKGKLNRVYEEGDHIAEQNFINFYNYVQYGTPDPEEKTIDITSKVEGGETE